MIFQSKNLLIFLQKLASPPATVSGNDLSFFYAFPNVEDPKPRRDGRHGKLVRRIKVI